MPVLISLATGALLAAVTPAEAAPVINSPADIKAITALEIDLNTQTNMNKLIDYYAPDATVFDLIAPGTYQGRAQIYRFFQQQLDEVQSMKFKMPEINIASDGTMACAAMQFHFDSTMKDGKTYHLSVRQIDAFRKIQGKWQIIEEHISVPADPKTGFADADAPITTGAPVNWGKGLVPGPAIPPAQARAEIRTWLEQGVPVTNAGQLMQSYGPSNNVLVFDSVSPGDLRGLAAIRADYGPMVGSYAGVAATFPIFADDSDGSLGAEINQQDLVLTLRNGHKMDITLRESDCMHRIGGKWYSFFEMNSFPMDPETGKSIMIDPAGF